MEPNVHQPHMKWNIILDLLEIKKVGFISVKESQGNILWKSFASGEKEDPREWLNDIQ